jgi:hypothetical protein
VGEVALDNVEGLASVIADSSGRAEVVNTSLFRIKKGGVATGLGGSVMESTLDAMDDAHKTDPQVWKALANLERDMQFLDISTGQRPQLSALELAALSLSVIAAGSGPLLLGGKITEFLAPASAAFAASIGIGAEFVGRVAVADGKEVAAASIQCAAEAEGLLANAERTKAVIPLCVGVGASAATVSLLIPVLLDSLGVLNNLQLMTEVYLCCPLVAVLAAAVASLALQETRSYTQLAITVGNRRFAKNVLVARTWLSTTEQIERKSFTSTQKWQNFALSVIPTPIFGALVPGALPTKTVIVAALAAAESAWFLAQAEYALGRGQDAVALKARSAALCDTYANQGARSSAILPFTSALASLCAAATAAIVEIPFVEGLASAGGVWNTLAEMLIVTTFPTFSALFAAAASVSKARCKVDAEAATQAASTLALEYDEGNGQENPIMRPFQSVLELMKLSVTFSLIVPLKRLFQKCNAPRKIFKLVSNYFKRKSDEKYNTSKTVTIQHTNGNGHAGSGV